MKKLVGRRGFVAVGGFLALALGSGNAAAQTVQHSNVTRALTSVAVNQAARPLGTSTALPVVSAVQHTIASTATVFSGAVSSVFGVRPTPQSEITRIAREANWLYRGGWPLYALVDRYSTGAPLSAEANCLATAVYFEARGETLEGQLAVARVVMNRAASGKYPPSWCATVKQPWQFSFVRNGRFPAITDMDAWRRAQGITRLAMANVIPSVPTNVLWYHADYVDPSWCHRLDEVEQIGAHIFYAA